MTTHTFTRAAGAAVLALTVSLTAACGSGDDAGAGSSAVSTTQHNDADVTFATDMLQHHAQALAMVDLTLGRDLSPEVEEVAEQVREAQAPEIETFADWLEEWDEKVPETVRDHASAHDDHGSMDMDTDMPGMMSAQEMDALEKAPDSEFQDRWLQMMVEHHQGAIEMARTELDEGRYKDALDLAKRISTSQAEEVTTMKGLMS